MTAAPRTFSRLGGALIVIVGLISFSALVVLTAVSPGSSGKNHPGAHALSRSAIGYAGMVQLLERTGRKVTISRAATDPARTINGLMILTPEVGDEEEMLLGLPTTATFRGAVLTVVPKWEVTPDRRVLGRVRKGDLDTPDVDILFSASEENTDGIRLHRTPGARPRSIYLAEPDANGGRVLFAVTGPIDRLQTLTFERRWKPVLVDETGGVLLARAHGGPLYALSDPDLLNTQGIRHFATARAGVAVLNLLPGRDNGPVFFDVTLNGFGRARNLLTTAFEPPFLAATICAFAAILLMAWHGFFRFGPERRSTREFALGKRALADNQGALIRMTGREHRMGEGYGHIVRDQVARAIGAPRDLDPEALDAFLDRLGASGRTSEPITALRGEARYTRTADDLLKIARRLHQWRLEMTRERN